MALSLCPWVALVVLVVLVQGGLGIAFTKVISVENGGPWGDWGDTEFCPENTYATGFQLKVGPGWGDGGKRGGQHVGDGSLMSSRLSPTRVSSGMTRLSTGSGCSAARGWPRPTRGRE